VPDQLTHRVEQAARGHWMDRVAGLGFLAKAAIYATIGLFALQFAFGDGGALLDSHDAARKVKVQPFGQVLLLLLGTGLVCYALWQFARAAFDPGRSGRPDAKRIARRLGWAGSGLLHGALAVGAFQTFAGHRGEDRKGSWIAQLLASPGGSWVMIGIGLGIIAFGGFQLWRAYQASFRKELETHRMSPTERRWALRVGRFGLAARGVIAPIVGWFFIQAGLHARASEARGTGAALREIASQRWGSILLAIVAAGLVAYAAYMMVNARYRKTFA
jgi:NADH:ubiquinone oxidoreductase subunit 5 (subunit L)/multisubunit Na+/H+ antiporter MnhA subunit